MEQHDEELGARLTLIERVRCLECAAEYVKPSRGGTDRENPGCPACGYVGWVTASIQLERRGGAAVRRRSAVGHLLDLAG